MLSCVLQGPSFSVDGWHVSWQQWDMRLSFNGREGLVLHCLSYSDPDHGGRRRPVLHRASIVEMCVPYAGVCVAGEGNWRQMSAIVCLLNPQVVQFTRLKVEVGRPAQHFVETRKKISELEQRPT